MFREMRRYRQQLPPEEAVEILKSHSHGVLAVLGDEGYPYAVPMNYAYADGKIYFHCAPAGHKMDAIRKCEKVSFTVVDKDTVAPEEFTSHFRSVIVFGRAEILSTHEAIREALGLLCDKYSPDAVGRSQAIESALARTAILVLTPEHITGKEAKELTAMRK